MQHNIPIDSVEIVWQFMQLDQPARACDLMVVLGSVDDRVAAYAAELADTYTYDHIVMTGGYVATNSNQRLWSEPSEAEHFAAVFHRNTNKPYKLLLETKAQNTAENVTRSFALLQNQGVNLPRTVQLVTKPYMQRRAVGTFQAQWPSAAMFYVDSPMKQFAEYCTDQYPTGETIYRIMKDFRNMQRYADKGWQTAITVPDRVKKAATIITTWQQETTNNK